MSADTPALIPLPVILRRGDRRTGVPRRAEERALHYARENLLAAATRYAEVRLAGTPDDLRVADAALVVAAGLHERAAAAAVIDDTGAES